MNDTTQLHELPLPGLREDNPRDFLAALGLLRLVDLMWPSCQANLAWLGREHMATLHCYEMLPEDWPEELLNALKELIQVPGSPLMHGEIIKSEYKVFRDAVERAIAFALTEQPLAGLPLILYSCYSSQIESEGGSSNQADFPLEMDKVAKSFCLTLGSSLPGWIPAR